MASAVARGYKESLGAEPQRGPEGQEAKPPEAEALLVFGRSMKLQICSILYNLEPQRNRIFVLYLQKNHGWPQNWGAWSKTGGGVCAPRQGPKTATNGRSNEL